VLYRYNTHVQNEVTLVFPTTSSFPCRCKTFSQIRSDRIDATSRPSHSTPCCLPLHQAAPSLLNGVRYLDREPVSFHTIDVHPPSVFSRLFPKFPPLPPTNHIFLSFRQTDPSLRDRRIHSVLSRNSSAPRVAFSLGPCSILQKDSSPLPYDFLILPGSIERSASLSRLGRKRSSPRVALGPYTSFLFLSLCRILFILLALRNRDVTFTDKIAFSTHRSPESSLIPLVFSVANGDLVPFLLLPLPLSSSLKRCP